jgi:hypothetical protein
MILCYLLAIAALNLGLGFLAAAYLRQRYEDAADVPLPLFLSLPPRQGSGGPGESPSHPAT